MGFLGTGGPIYVRETYLPILGFVDRFHKDALIHHLKDIAVHEIAHALGFSGSIWARLDLVGDDGLDRGDFTGEKARSAGRGRRMEVRRQEGAPGRRLLPLAGVRLRRRGDDPLHRLGQRHLQRYRLGTAMGEWDIEWTPASRTDGSLPSVSKPVAIGTSRALCGVRGIGTVGIARLAGRSMLMRGATCSRPWISQRINSASAGAQAIWRSLVQGDAGRMPWTLTRTCASRVVSVLDPHPTSMTWSPSLVKRGASSPPMAVAGA